MFNSFAIDHIVGDSTWSLRVRKRILQVAPYEYNVLIAGPSGTGKELVARAVHAHSSRSDKPFIPVDCATIPSGLFASQLFGHVKGAFTGASHASMGCFRAADGGTLFLDEIGELDLELQAKLLRVLQERQVTAVGSHESEPVNVRIVAATHRDLKREVKAGRFRLDLYYRLNVVRMETAALKDRPEDIPVLADHFLAKAAVDNGLPLKRLSRDALQSLLEHDWPGNVRELEHAVERAMIFTDSSVIDESVFDDLNAESIDPAAHHDVPSAPEPPPVVLSRPPDQQAPYPVMALPFVPPEESSPAEPAAQFDSVDDIEEDVGDDYEHTYTSWPTLAEIEREHIQKTLKETFFNQSAAARMLGIDRKQLARKIKKYRLKLPRLQRGRPAQT